ncbi:MAG: deoxyguanosinetriphosphate triphosphohydrolase family protein [Chloroflexota bacterium]|nr:deoxyguanosinetriphosphate triphosphohydrolase family protein [Chloroflexota bacterium]
MATVHEGDVQARLEGRERLLSPFAARSYQSRGRERPEEPSPLRTEFQRDRDRIIHCKAFRRLKHKTQVFIAPVGDHFVTRLTHTLEVAQIARTIARALNLNEDLAEAIALGHDLGHPPFGHAGEEALDEELRGLRNREQGTRNREQGTGSEADAPPPEGFRHAEQSLRVVERLENGGQGLNLTWEVRDGIVNSSKGREDILASAGGGEPGTLEGQIVRLADAVAYINHDIVDAIRAGVLAEGEPPAEVSRVLGRTHSQRINTLVGDIVEHSWAATGEGSRKGEAAQGGRRRRQGTRPPRPEVRIGMSAAILAAANALREFLFQRVYLWEDRRDEVEEAKGVVRFLFEYYLGRPQEIESDFLIPSDPSWRRVADYIAGMTDQFALKTAARLGYGQRVEKDSA